MSAIPGLDASMLTFSARVATFTTEHQPTKRRASSQKKKGPTTVSWPHQSPSPEELARAGFFYKPAPDSDDNAQCFHCAVKLDGWESQDVPLQEHLAHSAQCAYALSLSVFDKAEDRDPMSPELVEARTNTFADMWPHEQKKGWKPKVKQMVEAGWAYDPSPADDDGATCFYCNMSLDGWEPKDSPLEEHRRREPNCLFFALMDKYKASRRKGGRGRASTASKASRLSTQSIISTFSEAPSLMSLGDAGPATDVDESLAVDTTISSDTGKGRKKTTKGKKKTARQESVEPSAIEYPALLSPPVQDMVGAFPAEVVEPTEAVEEEQPKPKRGRKAKTVQDSTLVEDSVVVEPAKKTTRGRKKAKEPSPTARVSQDESQLQSELQDAVEFASALQSPPPKTTRGTKRTSDGIEKSSNLEETVVEEAPVKPKKAAKGTKGKKGKKAVESEVDEPADLTLSQAEAKPKRGRSKKAQKVEPEPEPDFEVEAGPEVESEMEGGLEVEEQSQPEPEKEETPEPEAANEVQAEQQLEDEYDQLDEDGQQDEQEPQIDALQQEAEDVHQEKVPEDEVNTEDEAEAQSVQEEVDADTQDDEVDVEEYAEQQQTPASVVATPASLAPTPAAEEFEPTPTPQTQRFSTVQPQSSVRKSSNTRRQSSEPVQSSAQSTPKSAQSSDAENHPPSSSSQAPATVKKLNNGISDQHLLGNQNSNSAIQPKEIFASPTKTTRIPLAASTPTQSPSRRSPSKFGRLTTSVPWEPVDLDTVFFDGENAGGNNGEDVFAKMLAVGGGLTTPEKKMSVEEWVRWRAELGETKLKAECERLVMLFEKEGNRGLEALNGIKTVS